VGDLIWRSAVRKCRGPLREAGAARVLLISDPNGIDVKGSEMKFTCGVQKPRAVVIRYKPSKAAGVFGEVTGIEYK
jgi:hypothetical protein